MEVIVINNNNGKKHKIVWNGMWGWELFELQTSFLTHFTITLSITKKGWYFLKFSSDSRGTIVIETHT